MQNKIEVNNLLDFYISLLTEKQQEICSMYFREDCSLMEIAEIMGISRAAVHDSIKRSEDLLLTYEKKLELYKSHSKRMEIYDKIKKVSDSTVQELINQCIDTEV